MPGTWLVRGGTIHSATGGVSLADSNAAVLLGPSTGTAQIPILATVAAFIYLDGSTTPVAVTDLAPGFTPADAFTMHHVTQTTVLGDSVELLAQGSAVGLFDQTFSGVNFGFTPPFYTDTPLTGMTLSTLGSLLTSYVLINMVAVLGGESVEQSDDQNTDPYDPFIFNLNGLYTIAAHVTSVLPTSGTILGGTKVTITGLGFTGATGVSFGGVPVTTYTIVSDTTITATTGGPHAPGRVDVVVASVGTGTGLYTYVIPPISVPPVPYRAPLLQQ